MSAAMNAARALALPLVVTVASAIVLGYAFDADRAAQGGMLFSLGGLYLVLGALTIRGLAVRGELAARFAIARGDISMAAVTAGVLYGGGRIAGLLLAPHGSPRELWLMRVYLQIGTIPDGKLLGVAIAIVAALEELVWRGLVMRSIEDVTTPVRAAIATTALYALAHAPTLYLMRMPGAGWNPLVVLAALGTGFVFAMLGVRTGRVTPSILAHAVFTWSIVEFPLWTAS